MPADTAPLDMAARPGRPTTVTGTLLLLAGFCSAPLVQALEIRPSITVGAVYTDNLNLAPEGDNKVDDIVTRLDPSIAISHVSQRIDFQSQYTYTYLRFSESEDSDSSYSQGTATLDLALVRDAFFLESLVDQSQMVVNPENSTWYTNVPIVDNRADELRLETSPHLNTEIFGVAVDSRYAIGTVQYGTDDIEDLSYQETDTAITGTERGKGLSWGLFHEYQAYDYDAPPDDKSQLAYGTLTYGFRQAGDFFVFGSLGKESSYENFGSASLEDTYWQIGFRNVTGRRLIEAAYGDRSFGTNVYALVRQQLNKGSFELAYREDPSVNEQLYDRERLDRTTPPPPDVPNGIDRPGVGNRFIYKLASATLVKELGRNDLEVVLFREIRDEILDRSGTTPEDVVQDSEEQVGISVSLMRELGQRTTVGLEGEAADREFRDGNTDRISALRLLGTYQLGRKVGIEGYLARYRQSGSDNPENNYKEFQVGLSISYDIL